MVDVSIDGEVGEQRLSQGSVNILRQGGLGELIVSQLHGRYWEENYSNRMFMVANPAIQALSLATATTYTGLCLINPVNSGVVIVIDEITTAIATFPAGDSVVCLAYNTAVPTTLTTPLTTFPAKISTTGASGAKAIAFSAVTLPVAPTIMRGLASLVYDTSAGFSIQAAAKDEISGAVLLEPGTSIEIVAVTTAVSIIGSITWEEVPLSTFPG